MSGDLAEIVDAVEELEAPEDLDTDAITRQEEGWLRFYLECPDCETPLVHTSTEGESVDVDAEDVRSASETELKAVCPDCRIVVGRVTVRKELFELTDPA